MFDKKRIFFSDKCIRSTCRHNSSVLMCPTYTHDVLLLNENINYLQQMLITLYDATRELF